MANLERRDFIKKAVAGGIGSIFLNDVTAQGINYAEKNFHQENKINTPLVTKKIIVGGGGIAGLCCAYELMKKGHEVVVLEASGRCGGTVLTVHDGLADGLYADFGAENITKPGYKNYWKYIDEFKLPVLPYFHRENRLSLRDNKWYTVEQNREMRTDEIKKSGGFNKRELKYLSASPSADLQLLYLEPYFEKFTSEYQPFGIGYDNLENISIQDFYKKEGASPAALSSLGGGKSSALYTIWQAYIMNKRGYDKGYELFRLKGGNQVLTDEFARRLGSRVKLDCQILEIEHGKTGVTVKYREFGEEKTMSADFFASCLRTTALKNITVKPELPPEKHFVFDNVVFDLTTRIVFQARSEFWLDDNISINLSFNHPSLRTIWQVADEVDTQRVALMAKAPGGTNPLRTLQTFKDLYPGKKSHISIEQTLVKDWSKDQYSGGCERGGFSDLGSLSKFWPHIMTPHGRIHFGGGHTDNRSWGMEAATNSANRVATEIDEA